MLADTFYLREEQLRSTVRHLL